MHTTITALQRNLDNPLRIAIRLRVKAFVDHINYTSLFANKFLIKFENSICLVGADIPVQLSSGSTQVVFAQNAMPGAGPSVAAIPLPLQLAASHLVHLPPLPPLFKYNCRLPILYIASASNPLFHGLRSCCLSISPSLSLTTALQSCQLIPEMPVQHHRYH